MMFEKKLTPQLANRLEGVSESATLKLNATVQAMRSQGVDVINLTAGEPDFFVPDEAKEAAIQAVKSNQSKYTPVAGILELRRAIAEKTNQQQPSLYHKTPWRASNVVVTNGAKQSLFNTLMAILNPGDEVLILSPYWLSYPEMVKVAGGIPKFITAPFSQGFKIKPEQLKMALGPKVKALILNSPNNPTGMIYSKKEYQALAEVLLSIDGAEKIWVISDEIYDRITFGEIPFCSFLEAAPELRGRTVTLNGMSKSAAMTGWRVGWSVGGDEITQAVITLQGQSTSGVNSLAQWASLAALGLPDSHFTYQVENFCRRRNLLFEKLKKASKMELITPHGAFYAFIGVREYLKEGEDSIMFAQRLLESAKVATVPGAPFGEPEFLRLSFASDEKSLEEGCKRILEYI
jgi:aspartate aminotransferase